MRNLGMASAIIIDGSYVTMKARPNDIDIILVLKDHANLAQDLTPAQYIVESMRMVKKRFGFDIRAAVEGSREYVERLKVFSQVRPDDPGLETDRKTKGLLRIDL